MSMCKAFFTGEKEQQKKSSKGSGKGTGKNNKGAKTLARPTPEGCWYCLRNDCEWAQQGKYNLYFRKQCGGCLQKKEAAMNPPAHSRIASKAAPSMSLKQKQAADSDAKKKEAAMKKEAALKETNAIPVSSASKALDVGEVCKAVKEAKSEDRRMTFTQEQADSFKHITPALTEILSSLSKERKPEAWRDSKDPAATAESFMKESAHVARG